jgi:hypothetical protein
VSKPRKSRCARDPSAGPGTCWFWWEGCPEKIPDCFSRFMRAWAEANGTSEPEKAIAAWQASRTGGQLVMFNEPSPERPA